jgi:Holliday junction resolvasome RuvABC DNA-binding subunit
MNTKKETKKALTDKIVGKIQEALGEINSKALIKMEKATAKNAKQLATEFSLTLKKVAKKEKANAKKLVKQAAKKMPPGLL